MAHQACSCRQQQARLHDCAASRHCRGSSVGSAGRVHWLRVAYGMTAAALKRVVHMLTG